MKHTKKLSFICPTCGCSFERLECQIKRNKMVFCSKKCMEEHRKNGSILTCTYCNKTFYRRFGEQKNTEKCFCSKKCYLDYRFENINTNTYIKKHGKHLHIIIAESVLNRKLMSNEVVHHIDGNKHNNNINNLAVLPNQEVHAKIHFGKNTIDISQYILSNIISNL